MVVKLLHFWKQYDPNDVTDEGILMEVKSLQFEKQYSSTEVIESGISMEVKPLQYLFVASIDNQRVAYNTVEKSYRGCFEDVKSCRFNVFNFI